jgi:uncharacterized NAD(P)/FAD-binding protein YdhS
MHNKLEDIHQILHKLQHFLKTLQIMNIQITKNINEIRKENDMEWQFIDLVRKYFEIMREDMVFIYPIKPRNPATAVKNFQKNDQLSFRHEEIIRKTLWGCAYSNFEK